MKTLLNNKKLVYAAAVMAFVAVFILLYVQSNKTLNNYNQPGRSVSPTYIQQSDANTWNGITPGFTKLSRNPAGYGEEVASGAYQGTLTRHFYSSLNDSQQTVIITNPSNVVVYVRTPLYKPDAGAIDKYATDNKLGNPSFEAYIKGGSDMVKVYVYLGKGVALEGNQYRRDIIAVRFFEPTTREKFMSYFGNDLTLSGTNNTQY